MAVSRYTSRVSEGREAASEPARTLPPAATRSGFLGRVHSAPIPAWLGFPSVERSGYFVIPISYLPLGSRASSLLVPIQECRCALVVACSPLSLGL